MNARDNVKIFANRDDIPEDLKSDFEYLDNHMMYKERISCR